MKKRTASLSVFVALVSVACARAPLATLSPGADAVRVARNDPGDNYQQLGSITARDGRGCGGFGTRGTFEGAVIDLRNRAYEMGADHVQIFTLREPHRVGDCFRNEYVISGTAFKKVRDLPSPIPIVNQPPTNDELMQKLRLLKQMREENLISEKQYEE